MSVAQGVIAVPVGMKLKRERLTEVDPMQFLRLIHLSYLSIDLSWFCKVLLLGIPWL